MNKPPRFHRNRAEVIDYNFVAYVEHAEPQASACANKADSKAPVAAERLRELKPAARQWIELFESQAMSRHMDIVARQMRARNEGFYTIGSSGHEGNAVLGRLTRHTDPAFLHYRSGAFVAERCRKLPGQDFLRDTALSLAASTDDPISGGRHKVWGSKELWIPPQTSTIASHLPKAFGAALSIPRARRLKCELPVPTDSIIICSFGDASVNHAVAQTAFNAAAWCAHQHLPAPILFVCEDNGLGISVDTPPGWIEQQFRHAHGIHYEHGNGLDLFDAYAAAERAVTHCRTRRAPVFLHLRTVRLLGHAGSDPEPEYHTWERIERDEANDPLIHSARLLIHEGVMTPRDVLDLYESVRERAHSAAEFAASRPRHTSTASILSALAPFSHDKVCHEAARAVAPEQRAAHFGSEELLPERGDPRHMAVLINQGLQDVLLKYPRAILFGEDIARKGGVYHVTAGLAVKFGLGRVFNTLLDETTILGMASGAAHMGLLPIPEIQYLAYYHNAEDQIRGEACSLQFFSNGQFRNPMVMRIAGWGYQKGFGGHFHNDNSIAVLRDVPGLAVCTPARGDDAVKMMRTCMAMAEVDGSVVAFIEPIALYMTRDLYEPRDGQWTFPYPAPGEFIDKGEGAVYHEDGKDITIITFANGVYLSLRAAKRLREQHGVFARVVDLRWLNPLNEQFIVEQALVTGRVLVVDEGRKTGGVNEAIMTILYEHCGESIRARRLTSLDSYIPLGAAAELVLLSEDDILREALAVIEQSTSQVP